MKKEFNLPKNTFLIILFVLFSALLSSLFFDYYKAGASSNLINSYSQSASEGLNLLSSLPTEITRYQAGNGSITFYPSIEVKDYDENLNYVPPEVNNYEPTAVLLLENAQINANTQITHNYINYFVGIAISEKVQIVLKGNNYINLNENQDTVGIFALNSNTSISNYYNILNVKEPHPVLFGLDLENIQTKNQDEIEDSYLNIKISSGADINLVNGMTVLGDISLKQLEDEFGESDENQDGPKFKDRGNLNINSGTIYIDLNDRINSTGIFVHNVINIGNCKVNVNGGRDCIFSMYERININNGNHSLKNFLENGLLTYNGNIYINNGVINIENLASNSINFVKGVCVDYNELDEDRETYSFVLNGGKIDIKINSYNEGNAIYSEQIILKTGDINCSVNAPGEVNYVFSNQPDIVTIGAEIFGCLESDGNELINYNSNDYQEYKFFSFIRIETPADEMDNVTLIVMIVSFVIFTAFLLTIYFVQKNIKSKNK